MKKRLAPFKRAKTISPFLAFFSTVGVPLREPPVGVVPGLEAMASPTAESNSVIRSFFIPYSELQNSNHLHLFHKILQLNIYILLAIRKFLHALDCNVCIRTFVLASLKCSIQHLMHFFPKTDTACPLHLL
jgi:hypothetical protein